MALLDIPPWLNVQPSFFTSALESGARVGLGLADARLRAETLAAAQAERQSRDQERADQAAERAAEFDATRLLNMQKLAQDAAQLQQQTAHQNALEAAQAAQESRLLNYQTGQLGVGQERNRVNAAANVARLAQAQNALDLRTKHYGELEAHNQAVLDLQREKAAKEKAPTVTKNVYDPENPFVAIGSIRGTSDQIGMPGQVQKDVVLPMPTKKTDLIKGQRYKNKYGVELEWDGENFLDYSTD